MTKRACPFEDNYGPQLKMHIGSDDIECRDDGYMKSVYDKTISKLYQGANNNGVTPIVTVREAQERVEEADNARPTHRLCVECRKLELIKGNCWFCEISLCDKCIKCCSFCSELFCSRCCIAIFKNGDNYSCLTCYS